VSQAYCSALPLAYLDLAPALWREFASIVLEAAYEATLLAALASVEGGGSNRVFLTLLGGGAFGNPDGWIYAAIARALDTLAYADLDVRLVSFDPPSPTMRAFVDRRRNS
jgi:hypothetical protein